MPNRNRTQVSVGTNMNSTILIKIYKVTHSSVINYFRLNYYRFYGIVFETPYPHHHHRTRLKQEMPKRTTTHRKWENKLLRSIRLPVLLLLLKLNFPTFIDWQPPPTLCYLLRGAVLEKISQPATHSRYPYNAIIAVVLHLFAREGMRVVVVFGVQSCCGLYYYYTYYADYIVTKQLTRSCTRLCEEA